MNFENYASRIASLTNFIFENSPGENKEVSRLTVHQGEKTQKRTLVKTKFSQFNKKRFYFSNGITSLSLSHSCDKELSEYPKKMGQIIERYFLKQGLVRHGK